MLKSHRERKESRGKDKKKYNGRGDGEKKILSFSGSLADDSRKKTRLWENPLKGKGL